jgi:hypothetical protein
MGPTPGVETPITPVEPDVLDGGDGVEWLGVDGLAPDSSSGYRQVNSLILVELADEHL